MSPIVLAFIQGGVGFAIGAGTNDLAIRWIFHTVFAKKKREIASAVQRVISNELMTPEKVAGRLVSPQSTAALQKAVEGYLAEICARDLPSVDTMVASSGQHMLVVATLDSVIEAAVEELGNRLSLPSAIRAFTDPFGKATAKLIAAVARQIPLGRLDRFAKPEVRSLLASRLVAECRTFVQNHTAELMQDTHIWDVIYDSIVGYDEEKMEAVTRSVANRELRGVTLWGGLIGFGVGFVGSLLVHALHL